MYLKKRALSERVDGVPQVTAALGGIVVLIPNLRGPSRRAPDANKMGTRRRIRKHGIPTRKHSRKPGKEAGNKTGGSHTKPPVNSLDRGNGGTAHKAESEVENEWTGEAGKRRLA